MMATRAASVVVFMLVSCQSLNLPVPVAIGALNCGYTERSLALVATRSAQRTTSDCSVAVIANMLAAERLRTHGLGTTRLSDPRQFPVPGSVWAESTTDGHSGVTLDQLAVLAIESAGRSGLRIDTVVRRMGSASQCGRFMRSAVAALETKPGSYLIANFDQGALFRESSVGHFAIIAAICSDMVLVVDPDADWYPPYWASVESMCAAVQTVDPTTNLRRGFIVVDAAGQ